MHPSSTRAHFKLAPPMSHPATARSEALIVIPVLDLKGGQVVHARRGERDSYAPIVTPLAATSEPADVARGLLRLHPFRHLYVADLDGIEGRGRDDETLARLRRALPDEVMLWVDNGLADEQAARAWMALGLGRLVLGSESQTDEAAPSRLGAILSLDFRKESFLGPPALLNDSKLWPDDVIVMTLARVGSDLGPDRERLQTFKARSPATRFYAAGGVRDLDDLRALNRVGAAGALVASALHDGRITSKELAILAF